MQNKWGTYPWFLEYGIDLIHPDDLEHFKKEAHNCKVFECVSEDAQFITLKYSSAKRLAVDPESKFSI